MSSLNPALIEPLETDKAFDISPDNGHPLCICSRCSSRIQEMETCIRLFTTDGNGQVTEESLEYRYCEQCVFGKKFFNCQMDIEFGSRCEEQCEECKREEF
jgi:hypothetical protein